MQIILHPTHITMSQHPSRPPTVHPLHKTRALGFPLDQVLIMQAGDSPHVEVSLTSNLAMSWICAELFGDAIGAMERGPKAGSLIIRVPLTEQIIEQMAEKQTVPPKQPDIRPAEGTRANPIRPTLRKPDAVEVAPETTVGCVTDAAESATWGDAMPATSRDVQPGDLQIVKLNVAGGYWIEIAERVDGGFTWTRATVPSKLLGTFPDWAGAAQAIRIAGLAHRLIDAEEAAA